MKDPLLNDVLFITVVILNGVKDPLFNDVLFITVVILSEVKDPLLNDVLFITVVILNEVKDPLLNDVLFITVVILNGVKDPLLNDLRSRGNGNFSNESTTQDTRIHLIDTASPETTRMKAAIEAGFPSSPRSRKRIDRMSSSAGIQVPFPGPRIQDT